MANLDRAMRRVCDNFGEEAVMAWCMSNLSASAYPASRSNHSVGPTPNRTLRAHDESNGGGRVLLDREHPEREDSAPSPTPVPTHAPPQAPVPKFTPGLFSLF